MSTITIKNYLLSLQSQICKKLEEEDGLAQFSADEWARKKGGGGITKTLANGSVFEKGGVNFSHVFGSNLPPSATVHRPDLAKGNFEAMGVSLVVHPINPYVPTVHFNVRYFEAKTKENQTVWWFGGGMDLTPYYPYEEDAYYWHTVCHDACKSAPSGTYERFKKECDEYFFLHHRNETRGIGGLFFDDLNEWGFDDSFAFIQSVGDSFTRGYLPIVAKRKSTSYTEREKEFQLYRRGRYVEFNLLYDRGTIFGLQSKGRTESILVSMPPAAKWEYSWVPKPGSPEDMLYQRFLKPQNWLNLTP